MKSAIQSEQNHVLLVSVNVFRGLKDIDANAVEMAISDQVVIQSLSAVAKLTTSNYSSQVALKQPSCENVAKLKLTIAVANILPSFVKLK